MNIDIKSDYILKYISKYTNEKNKEVSSKAWSYLISIFKQQFNIDISNNEILLNEYNKPYIKNLNYFFNISHSKNLVAIIISDKETPRLEVLCSTNDGFKISEEDFKLRGSGDIFGIRQSGVLDFKLADVFQDAKIMQRASEAAIQLMKRDPLLQEEENQNLKAYLNFYMREGILETTL